MRLPKLARATVILAGSALALIAAPGTTAGAATHSFPDVPTLTYGGVCGTSIRTWADTGPEWPGRAVLNVRANPVVGVGSGSHPLAPLCEVLTTVSWRNLDTGASGAFTNNVVTGIYGSIQYSLFQDTGPGRVDITVTTNHASIPAHGSFVVAG